MTDADWALWLQDSSQERCTLVQLTFLGADPGIPDALQEHKAYVSDFLYASVIGGVHQRYDACILEVPEITEAMSELMTGRSEQSYGKLVISNENGIRNDWLRMNWDGRSYVQYLGHPSWNFADFRPVLVGVIGDCLDDGENRISFTVTDQSKLLDRPVMTTLLGGTGPNANALMPLALGWDLFNVKPMLYDQNELTYQLSGVSASGANEYVGAITSGRENGVELFASTFIASVDAATNTITTTTAHGCTVNSRVVLNSLNYPDIPAPLAAYVSYWVIASGLTPTTFKLSATMGGTEIDLTTTSSGGAVAVYPWTYLPTVGRVKLAASPAGEITLDMYGLLTGCTLGTDVVASGTSIYKVGDIIKHVLTSPQTNTAFTSSDIDADSLSDLNTLCPQTASIYLTDQITFADLIDKLMLSIGGWSGFDPFTGKLVFGRLDSPAAGTPVYSFNAGDIIGPSLKIEQRIMPKAKVKVKGQKNWTVQSSGLSESLSVYYRAYYGLDYYTAVGDLGLLDSAMQDPASHKLATFPEPYESCLTNTADIDAEATRLALMYQYRKDIWAFQSGPVSFLLRRGDLIYVEDDAFTGYGIVVSVKRSTIEGGSVIRFLANCAEYYPSEDRND